MAAPVVPVVITAAGRGARIGGEPKALLRLARETALGRIAATCRAAGLAATVVTGAHREAVEAEAARLGLATAHNPDWERGRTGSVQVGWKATGESAILLWPVDVPLVRLSTVMALVRREGSAAAVPLVGQLRGHPVILGRAIRDEVLALESDAPLNLVMRARGRTVPVDDPGALLNINTLEDLDAARRYVEAPHA